MTNETSKTLSFTVTDDGQIDTGESIQLAIGTTLPDRVTAGTPNQATVTITDTGVTPVTVKFTSSTYTASEGTIAHARLTLDKAPGRTVVIPVTYAYQSGATAADFGRFGFAQTSITFAPTDVAISFGPSVIDDGIVDSGESFTVTIGTNLPDGVTAGTPNQATVNITDTGLQQLIVQFFTESFTATEGTGALMGVHFNASPKRIVVIPFTISYQGGASNEDIGSLALSKDPVTGTLTATFAIGEQGKPVTFDVLMDDLVESGESVTISISSTLPEGVTLGANSQVTVTFTDAPEPEVDTTNQPINSERAST